MYNLKIRNFILSHDNWEELLQAPPYNLTISRDEGYIMFKYSQIDSDFNDPIVQEALFLKKAIGNVYVMHLINLVITVRVT